MKDLIRLLSYTRKYWWLLFLTMLSLVGITAMNLIAPWYIRDMTSILMAPGPDARDQIIRIAFILLGSYLFRLLFRFAYSYLSHIASWNVVAGLRGTVYAHLQKLSLSYYHDKQTGHLMSRVINDTAVLEQMVAHSIPDIVTNVLIFAGVMTLLMFINVRLTLLTMIPIPLIFIMMKIFSQKVRPFFSKAQEKLADLNATLQDNLSGIREIQVFNQQAREEEKVYSQALLHVRTILKALFFSAFFHPSVEFVTAIGTVMVVAVGGIMVLDQAMSVADIVGFLMYLSMFYAPVSVLARVTEEYEQAVAGARRLFEVLDIEPDIKDIPGAVDMGRAKGHVRFENVWFEYDSDTPVLEDITFEAKPGEMVAFVGPTGVGKTTLISLLARFYDPTAGKITVDGMDIRQAKLASLRENISMVLQDVFLFNGTIGENIAYGCHDATAAGIENAAKIACIHDFIVTLPDGYDTYIGERGVRLSGGQKQRIAIARAVLRDSPILILDEATAAVDVETESRIQSAIENLVGSRTVFVIAHRLSTVRRANQIMVLSDCKLIERGTHEELVAANGFYARYAAENLKK